MQLVDILIFGFLSSSNCCGYGDGVDAVRIEKHGAMEGWYTWNLLGMLGSGGGILYIFFL